MKTIRHFALSLAICCAHPAYATAPEDAVVPDHKSPGWQPPPAAVGDWADRCSDFTVNSWSFKDPKNFALWLNTFTEPAIYMEFGERMQEPRNWSKMLGTLVDPGTAKNYLEWSDPAIYAKWAGAAANPAFYTSVMMPFLDPGKYMRWMMAPLNPRAWAMATNMMNPALWTKWATAPADPQILAPLAKAGDPNNLTRWTQVLNDPRSYSGLNGFVPQASAQPGSANRAFNFFNPGAYFKFPTSTPGAQPESGEGKNESGGPAN